MPHLTPSGTLHFHIWLLLSMKLLWSRPKPAVICSCSAWVLFALIGCPLWSHCPGHWQLHTGLAADFDKARTAPQLCLSQSCRGFHLACNSVTCCNTSYPVQCLLFLVSAVPVVPAPVSVRKRQHAVMK